MSWNVWNVQLEKWENLISFKTRRKATSFLDEVVKQDLRNRGGGPFEVRKVGSVLENHGTRFMQLKPSMIWGAAMEDLKRREHNEAVAASRKTTFPRKDEYKQYAFHRRHVLGAGTANDILRAAIAEPALGLAAGKRNTRLLYSDVELLKAALK